MKQLLIMCLGLLWAGTAFPESAVTIPYNDFKALYGERLKSQWEKEHKAEDGKRQSVEIFMYSVNQAAYTMTLSPGGVLCVAEITGTVISGEPEPIPLFKHRVIVKEIIQVTGGDLLCDRGPKHGISFLPLTEGAFEIKLSFYVLTSEDNQSWVAAMDIPGALTNRLDLKTDKHLTVTRAPGVKDSAGHYHFSPRSALEVRFSENRGEKKSPAKKKPLSSRYSTVSTPAIVLDALFCFTSFEENGNALTVIRMDIPKEAGESLDIKAIPHSTIWNYRVNGKKMNVFEKKDPETVWVLPLAKEKASVIELALLSKGEKMGLSGRLSWSLPHMGFPARTVNVALGLPERVELMAFEGPVSPTGSFNVRSPGEFIGKPYYFSQSFYSGEEISMAVSYKEPVK